MCSCLEVARALLESAKIKKSKIYRPRDPQPPPHYRSSWYLGVRPRPKRNPNDIFEKHITFWSGLLDGRMEGPSSFSRRALPLFPGGPFRYFPAGPSSISRRPPRRAPRGSGGLLGVGRAPRGSGGPLGGSGGPLGGRAGPSGVWRGAGPSGVGRAPRGSGGTERTF